MSNIKININQTNYILSHFTGSNDRLYLVYIFVLTSSPLQEGIKEQDKTLIEIFKKVQGDVKELNGFVVNHRNSSSLQGTPSSASIQPPPPLPPASQQ